MKKQKENSREGITWSEMGKQNVQAEKVYSSGENVIRNFQYGPPTQFVRAIIKLEINSLAQLACPNLFSTEVTNTKKPAIQESPQSQSSVVIREFRQGRVHDSENIIWKDNSAFRQLFLKYSK